MSIIIIMNRLIRTSRRRHIAISPQINPKRLISTHQPRTQILPLDIRVAPLHRITTKRKRAIRILLRAKRNAQFIHCRVCLGLYICIEQAAGDQLYKLTGHDLELPCGRVGVEERGAGLILGLRLQVFVEVGGFDGADPKIAALECCTGPTAC